MNSIPERFPYLGRERSYTTEVLWNGPDVKIAESVLVNQSARVPIILNHESLPHYYSHSRWSAENFQSVMRGLYPSVRSRYAQLGINIDDNVMKQIEDWLKHNKHVNEKGYVLNSIAPIIDVKNYGGRPVQLGKGSQLFRFHEDPQFTMLEGDNLKDTVQSGLIKIEGERLGAWTYSYNDSDKNHATGIFVHVKRNNRKWIPPDSGKAISIPDVGEYREVIDSLLKAPIPEKQYGKLFWIGETVGITLSPQVDAILDNIAIKDVYEGMSNHPANGIQINSRLIDGGKTNWPVRVEILSDNCHSPQYVHFRFIEKRKISRISFDQSY
jgi:hypothetical protein